MARTSREHLGNILKIYENVLDGKVVFVLKVYDLIITTVDLLANSSNHLVMFPEYSEYIPRLSVSICPEYCKVIKIFLEVKKI